MIGTNDLANPVVIAGHHATHPVVTREYIDTYGGFVGGQGKVYFDGYQHQYVDTELVETAKTRGRFVPCPRAHVEHRHPLFDRSVKMDDTYRKALADGQADRRLYFQRQPRWLNKRTATVR